MVIVGSVVLLHVADGWAARLHGADAILLILAAIDDPTWTACRDLAERLGAGLWKHRSSFQLAETLFMLGRYREASAVVREAAAELFRGRRGNGGAEICGMTIAWRAGPNLVTRFNNFPAVTVTGGTGPGHSTGEAMEVIEAAATSRHRSWIPTPPFNWSGSPPVPAPPVSGPIPLLAIPGSPAPPRTTKFRLRMLTLFVGWIVLPLTSGTPSGDVTRYSMVKCFRASRGTRTATSRRAGQSTRWCQRMVASARM